MPGIRPSGSEGRGSELILTGDAEKGFPTGRKFAAGFVTYCPFRSQNRRILLDKLPGLCSRLRGGAQVSGIRCRVSGARHPGFGLRDSGAGDEGKQDWRANHSGDPPKA